MIACSQPVDEQPTLKPLTGKLPSGTATTVDGHTISYQIFASSPGSPAIILLHMLGRTRTDWDSVAKWLQGKGYTVMTLDLRGHGQSTGNWEEFTPEDFNKMTLDVAAVKSVLQHQKADVTRLAIIGASIGANIALNYAVKDSDVKTVILLSPGLEYRGIKLDVQFNKPFLVVASSEDKYSAQSSQQVANKNSYAKLVMYKNAGHGTNMFGKTELAPTMLDWLKENV